MGKGQAGQTYGGRSGATRAAGGLHAGRAFGPACLWVSSPGHLLRRLSDAAYAVTSVAYAVAYAVGSRAAV
jgi:hypothetical protein